MHRRRWLLLTCLVFLCLVGCGDSPKLIIRDAITLYNEELDTLNKIPDDPEKAEEAAEEYVKKQRPLFKKRDEFLKKRYDNATLNADKEMKETMKFAAEYWKDEIETLGKRRKFEEGRLRAIMRQIADKEAEKLRGSPNVEVDVGTKAELENKAEVKARLGIRLIIVEPDAVAPKLAAAIKEAFEVKK